MATAVTGLLAIFMFLLVLRVAGLVPVCANIIKEARSALGILTDPGVDDIVKERVARHMSLQLFGALGSVLLRAMAVFSAALLPILISDLLEFSTTAKVATWLSRPTVIAGSTFVLVAYMGLRHRWPRI